MEVADAAPGPDGSRFASGVGSSGVAPIAAIVVVAAASFWPLLRGFPRVPWSDGGDGSAFLWNYWNLPRALLAGENPFTEEGLFFPVGAHTVFNTNTPLVSVVSWPLQQLFGLTGASVVVGFAAVVLSGVGAYLLARRISCDRLVATFAGIAFALLPWRTNRIITHLNLIHTEIVAFALLAAVATLDAPSRRRGVLAGAAVGCAVLTDFNTSVMAVLAIGVVAAVRWKDTREAAIPLAIGAVVALVLALPILVPLALDLRSGEAGSPPGLGGANAYSADVLSWVLPLPGHPLWGAPFQELYTTTSGQERFAYIGLVVGSLAVVGIVSRGVRSRWPWIGVLAVFGLLSFGPGLHVNGWTGSAFSYEGFRFSVPMPYLLLHQVPGFEAFRAPARFASVASLAAVLLAALGLRRIQGARPTWAVAVPVVAIVLVVVDFLPPREYLQLDPAIDPSLVAMRDDPDPGAVLDLPLQFRTGIRTLGDGGGGDHSRFMYFATVHERAMAGGSVSRLPEARFRALEDIDAYRQILTVQGAYGPTTVEPSFTRADLADLGLRFVVVHHDSVAPLLRDHVAGLGLEPFADSRAVTVWKVPS